MQTGPEVLFVKNIGQFKSNEWSTNWREGSFATEENGTMSHNATGSPL